MHFELRPTKQELEKASQITEETLKKAENFYDKEKDIKVDLRWNLFEYIPWIPGAGCQQNKIQIKYNTLDEDWKEKLKTETMHTYFEYCIKTEINSKKYERWEVVLAGSFAALCTQKCLKSETKWIKISETEINQKAPEFENYLGNEEPLPEDKSLNQNFIALLYIIGEKLHKNYELDNYHTIEKEEVIQKWRECYS